jgi:hypothetical protein
MEREFGQRKSRIRRSCLAVSAAALLLIILCGLTAYFYGAPAYAASQIAQAKSRGVYPSPEEAFAASMPAPGWTYQGARMVNLTNVQCQVNDRLGRLPFVWFCMGVMHYDRIPSGHTSMESSPGGYVLNVSGGWVWMPEGAFPELVGRIMEKYHMEGVK